MLIVDFGRKVTAFPRIAHLVCWPTFGDIKGKFLAACFLHIIVLQKINISVMQKQTLLFILFLAALSAQAQTSAKKYVFIEHFTNSKCSVCASKNPAFYNLIDDYPNDIHHISIHPPIPYNTCAFYLANPTENNTRAAYYSVFASPTIAINGEKQPLSTPLLSLTTLQSYLGETSPLWLQVSESGPSSARVATVKAHSLSNIPAGDYKIYVAVVEKTVAAPPPPNNGEAIHHDVFRDMLTDINGAAFTPAAVGQSVDLTYNYSIANGWDAEKIYVLAWVQNTADKAVLNSGTRFDPVLTDVKEAAPQTVKIQPNPVTDFALAQIGDDRAEQVEVFDISGQRVTVSFENEDVGTVGVPTATLAAGVYFVKITGKKNVYVAKMLKS